MLLVSMYAQISSEVHTGGLSTIRIGFAIYACTFSAPMVNFGLTFLNEAQVALMHDSLESVPLKTCVRYLQVKQAACTVMEEGKDDKGIPHMLSCQFESPWPAGLFQSVCFPLREREVVDLCTVGSGEPVLLPIMSEFKADSEIGGDLPSTEHMINPTLHDLMLDELVVADLYKVRYTTIVIACSLRHIEVVVEAGSTVCQECDMSLLPSGKMYDSQAQMRWME